MRFVNKFRLFILPVLLLAAASCRSGSEIEVGPVSGGSVSFGVSTAWSGSAFTRTEYSGEDQDGNPISAEYSEVERINWIPDYDRISIACQAATGTAPTAYYAISGTPAVAGASHTASISAVNGEMKWGIGSHTFFAFYPAPGSRSNYEFQGRTVAAADVSLTLVSAAEARFSASIPAVQEVIRHGNEYKANMNYAYMYATPFTCNTGTATVPLAFHPMVTALEFSLYGTTGDLMESPLTEIRLRSENGPLAGGFTAVLEATSSKPTITVEQSTKASEITVALADKPVLNASQPLKFTILTLPLKHTNLHLRLVFENGAVRELPLRKNGQFLAVEAMEKMCIANVAVPATPWEYTLALDTTVLTVSGHRLEEGSTGLNSWREKGGVREYVDVTVEFSPAAADGSNLETYSSSLSEIVEQHSIPAGIGGKFSVSVRANTSPEIDTVVQQLVDRARNMKEKTPQASSLDLSLYDFENLSAPRASGKPTTANCYVVDRPGSYRFPIVYGNAVDWSRNGVPLWNNGVNLFSYTSTGGDEKIWSVFQRFDGKAITSPYVLDDLGLTSADVEAVVVWEEVKDGTYSFISGLSVADYPSSGIFYDPDEGSFKTSLPYISFNVPVGDIDPDKSKEPSYRITGCRPGNALIALRLKSAKTVDGTFFPGGTIIWSWHIWLTDGMDTDGDGKGDTMDPVEIETNSEVTLPTVDIMQMNLGYIPATEVTYYKDRVFYVRIKQVRGNAAPVVLKVIQKLNPNSEYGTAPFYQWGRKDPFIRGSITRPYVYHVLAYISNNQEVWSPSGYTITSGDKGLPLSNNTSFDISAAVQNPHTLYFDPESGFSWMGYNYDGNAPYPPCNRWNMFVTSDYGNLRYVGKTVYDPCPPGYCVLHQEAFLGVGWHDRIVMDSDITNTPIVDLDGDGTYSGAENYLGDGVWFWADRARTRTFFLPACGMRNWNLQGEVDAPERCRIWTASCRNGGSNSMHAAAVGYTRDASRIHISCGKKYEYLDYYYTQAYSLSPQVGGYCVRPMKEFHAGDMLSQSAQTGGQKVTVVTGSGDRWD